MGRSWNRYDASLEDIKRCRKAILSQFPNATDIYFDEYLVDTHQNESCNANKFYYGAVLETKDGRFQAATSYGRIGEHLENRKAFGGIKAFDEGVFTNFDSAKRKLNEKLDKKKRGKRCSKCKTRQSYSPFAPKNAEEYGAENMSPQVFGKLVGQYPQPPNNPLPVGGFMDEGFEWTVNQAENEDGWFAVSHVSNEKQAKNEKAKIEKSSKGRYEYKVKENPDKKGWSVLARSIMESEDYYCTKCDEGFSSITPTDEGQFCNNCLPDSATPHNEMDATTQKEEFGSSNIVSKVKNNWLNGLVGIGVGLVAFDFLKKKGYVANADTLIESPNTGDLTPADYEEIVVESTGYYVPIIPVSLDGSFMGSRFHALPTDRYVYDSLLA